MRMLRLSLTGAVFLALIGGLGGTALAQTADEDAPDPLRASHFTMSAELIRTDPLVWSVEHGYGEALGREAEAVVEASDPRLSGTWRQSLNARAFPIDVEHDIHAVVWSGAVRIDNEDGSWVGTLEGYHDGAWEKEWNQLRGEGAYEGLTAVFRFDEATSSFDGVVIPGVPPDHPSPLTPTD